MGNNKKFKPRVMMSINTKQVERIKSEGQSVILRKTAAPDFDDDTEFKVYIYESSPIKRIIGEFTSTVETFQPYPLKTDNEKDIERVGYIFKSSKFSSQE